MEPSAKLKSLDELASVRCAAEAAGRVVVFTNGCFDLLHAGHVRYLEAARREGDLLIVGINADRSVRALKGKGRPIVPEAERAYVLAGLASVDYVTVFEEADPLHAIRTLRPDVLVKGGDWPEEAIIGADAVRSWGGRVVRVAITDLVSTSALIERICERCGPAQEPGGHDS
jgi:D-beta-D-heptose 7-phosphate kinase/D-beta-D-heptose 1-phosphate adenosyltransferase